MRSHHRHDSAPIDQPAPYLVALRLAGRKVLIVGGGQIGTGKIETLLGASPSLVVVDPTPSERVCDLAERGLLELRRRTFRPSDVFRSTLVVAATGEPKTNRWIRRCARLGRSLVNAVDDPPNCDVTVPSVVRRGPATIAISTGGATPAGARFLREELSAAIDNVLPPDCGQVLDAAAAVRHQLRGEGNYRFAYSGWRQSFFEPAFAALRRGEHSTLAGIVEHFAQNERENRSPKAAGSVALVGAGPGGDDLITLRGARSLARADVVFYDRLADPTLLAHAPVAAERIPVGKGRGFGQTQEEITDQLIARAKSGQQVVRLKGGDPFVFGRGGEEHSALVAAGVEVQVVPGVSSALAAAALAGIPVTDRRCSSSVAVLTGHSKDEQLPRSHFGVETDTVVVLMAAKTADIVARRLISGGRANDEPVAFVHRAGSAHQQTWAGELGQVAIDGCPFPSPTVMIVGDVVNYAPALPSAVESEPCFSAVGTRQQR